MTAIKEVKEGVRGRSGKMNWGGGGERLLRMDPAVKCKRGGGTWLWVEMKPSKTLRIYLSGPKKRAKINIVNNQRGAVVRCRFPRTCLRGGPESIQLS